MASPTILVVDDTPQNVRLLDAILSTRDYAVLVAASGPEALELVARQRVDLVLLDILMPGMDGYEVCRRLRAEPATAALPIIMITSAGNQEKLTALEAGADDFIPKPFDKAELLARVRSLLRVKEYYDRVQEQAQELAEWNRTLEERVEEQVREIQRLARLRRFLSPQLADLIVTSGDDSALKTHRRQIAVLFCDLHGFTGFAEAAEPEDVMTVLREFHEILGNLVHSLGGTVGYFAGDGLMVFFNDPLPCEEPALKAVQMAEALRVGMAGLTEKWRRLGHRLGFGVGVTLGYATLGEIGFEGRFDYGAIGSVVNLASRLCDETESGQVLISQSAYAAVADMAEAELVPALALKGFAKPVSAYSLVRLKKGVSADGDGGPDGLTTRETEILTLLAAGRSSKEIADDLVLSARTVERHIANVYAKIGAHGRAEATAYAIDHGLRVPRAV
jgi:class 3 adenylate cyclase/CheY-like chemotaxis protein